MFIDRRDAIEPAFEALRGVVGDVLAVEEADVLAAKDLLHARPALSAREALHGAVMRRYEIAEVLSFDQAFDRLTGITRLTAPASSG